MNKTPKNTPAADSHYARLRRAHRDRTVAERPKDITESVRLYGLHTVRAALDNPNRSINAMWITRNALSRLEIGDVSALPFDVDIVEPRTIEAITGSEAVHQGVVIEAEPLLYKALNSLGDTPLVLVLDQVTDPHNVGAIMRSAVAFGAGALITTARHSPAESGVLAKAASGALEFIDHITVRNLAETIESLNSSGFLTIGLDSEGQEQLENAIKGERIALVLGAEGKGLRQKTRQTVSVLARLDMPGAIRSLNVSNAAAVALYAARRHLATTLET